MEEMFDPHIPTGEESDIQLCIFPHLDEFLAIDLRDGEKQIHLLNARDIFSEHFFHSVEFEFSEALRQENAPPFAHMFNLPLRMEEMVREIAMTFILDRLGVRMDDESSIPTVVVIVVSGSSLPGHSEQVVSGLKRLIQGPSEDPAVADWEEVISRLVAQEHEFAQKENLDELTDATLGDLPDYSTLWGSRN